jgi:hypothetical protein
MTQRYELKQISPEEVEFAQANPRGESSDQIEADPSYEQLKESVWKYGVLVPIVVHSKKSGKPYILVDGERRLRAALAANLPLIPAHVAPQEAELDDLIRAFHIHMLRKQWKAVAQAKALKRIIEGLEAGGTSIKASAFLEELSTVSGCSETRLKALRRAIRYPADVLRDVDEGRLNFSHLVQIEESFIEAVNARFPDLMKQIGEKRARQVLIAKAKRKTLTSTRALMENVIPVIMRANTTAEIAFARRLIIEFIDRQDMSAEKVLQRYEDRFPTSGRSWAALGRDIVEIVGSLNQKLDSLTTDMVKGQPSLMEEVRESLEDLKAKLGVIIRRIKRIDN